MNTATAGSTGPAKSKSTMSAASASAPTSTAAPKRVAGAPRPKQTVTTRFHSRLAKIFAGERSKKDFLFEPLSPMDKKKHVVIGTVTDPKAREFFSLYFRLLSHNVPRIRAPRTPAEIPAAEASLRTINDLANTAKSLGFQIVADQFPKEKDQNWELKAGWVVVREKTIREFAPEAIRDLGIPSFFHHMLIDGLPEEIADKPMSDLRELLQSGKLEEMLMGMR